MTIVYLTVKLNKDLEYYPTITCFVQWVTLACFVTSLLRLGMLYLEYVKLNTHAERQKFYVIVSPQSRLWHTAQTSVKLCFYTKSADTLKAKGMGVTLLMLS